MSDGYSIMEQKKDVQHMSRLGFGVSFGTCMHIHTHTHENPFFVVAECMEIGVVGQMYISPLSSMHLTSHIFRLKLTHDT